MDENNNNPIDEDDDFEDFPVEEWEVPKDQDDSQYWENNWDDSDIDDEFSKQLRAELQKKSDSGSKK
ncbi:hypothetical protein BCR32DRAFT_98777 [Anaeromyces robustus]|uniref:26S proteasome complex subunit SEM1 n=1 Tax=Anaeromyces robustus TaxID=1754192 RepID=A0A1Y1WND8_9FUNG|nr:hypothetical protein BCR32DRAFT_98777 [Anaeromyces robustus]|eukprot:ORX75070.1 hypothetical protein BCR32DRAFT_98777 [Anaeromyces robustus]